MVCLFCMVASVVCGGCRLVASAVNVGVGVGVVIVFMVMAALR